MKVVFVGRRNAFDLGMIRWLAENYTVQAAFFIEEDRLTIKGKLHILALRARRFGFIRLFDELLFRVYYIWRYSRKEAELIAQNFPIEFREDSNLNIPTFLRNDIHDPESIATLQKFAPDLVFCNCTHIIFKKPFYSIPRLGMFILHEGITPEYRGLHTPGWAILRKEYQFLGYTLLKISPGLDAGPILCQGVFPYRPEYELCFGYVGHAALLAGLPEMKSALDKLYADNGQFCAIPQQGRRSRNHSWIRMSSYLRLMLRRSGNGSSKG
ncbi:MAG: formyltransferase family protein [Candidatus Zixiibacteriota bacterium]